MTREELKENICGMTYEDMFEYIYSLEQHNTELGQKLSYFENDGSWNELVFKCELAEQQVKELQEPKSCNVWLPELITKGIAMKECNLKGAQDEICRRI